MSSSPHVFSALALLSLGANATGHVPIRMFTRLYFSREGGGPWCLGNLIHKSCGCKCVGEFVWERRGRERGREASKTDGGWEIQRRWGEMWLRPAWQ